MTPRYRALDSRGVHVRDAEQYRTARICASDSGTVLELDPEGCPACGATACPCSSDERQRADDYRGTVGWGPRPADDGATEDESREASDAYEAWLLRERR